MGTIQEGQHKVKVSDYGITEKDGKYSSMVEFVDVNGDTIRWFCTLGTPKALEYLANRLVNLRFKGTDISDLTKENMFPTDYYPEIKVVKEQHENKEHLKVGGIYDPDNVPTVSKITSQEAAMKIPSIAGKLMELKQKSGLPNHAPNATENVGF